jgi:hypothetical protein
LPLIKTRPRCPCCGSRLNENAINREIDFDDGRDILEQDIGGRGNVSNLGEYTFADNLDIAQYFLDNVNLAKKYLEGILGVQDDTDDTKDITSEDDEDDTTEDDTTEDDTTEDDTTEDDTTEDDTTEDE